MSIVNATLYPLSDPDHRTAIVGRAASQLGEDGAAAFPDFIAPAALADMVAEAAATADGPAPNGAFSSRRWARSHNRRASAWLIPTIFPPIICP